MNRLLAGARRSRPGIRGATSISTLIILLFFVTAVFLYYFPTPFQLSTSSTSSSSSSDDDNGDGDGDACDMSRGEWVHDETAQPYYTNTTCRFIQDYQNCIKFGKPSLDFLNWRWKPAGCELRRFDATRFFRLVRAKSMLFVGDSLSSSHLLSLLCILSQVEKPEEWRTEHLEHWRFKEHDFAVAFFWTPFQVRWRLTRGPATAVGVDRQGEVFAGPSDLHLDEPDERWTSAVASHDYVVVSGSHWFALPAMYYLGGRLVGCHGCDMENTTKLPPEYAQRAAFRTVLRALAVLDGFKGTAILRTVAPTHYEHGGWFDGGECTRTRPFGRDETAMAEPEAEFYGAQVAEFRVEEAAARRNGVPLRLLDVSRLMQLRPDGHPDRYGHGRGDSGGGFDVDCLHWCLPGPIDVWNELLLQMLSG